MNLELSLLGCIAFGVLFQPVIYIALNYAFQKFSQKLFETSPKDNELKLEKNSKIIGTLKLTLEFERVNESQQRETGPTVQQDENGPTAQQEKGTIAQNTKTRPYSTTI